MIVVSLFLGFSNLELNPQRKYFVTPERQALAFARRNARFMNLVVSYLGNFGLAQDWELFAPNPTSRIDEAAIFASENQRLCEGNIESLDLVKAFKFSEFKFDKSVRMSTHREFKLISRIAQSVRAGNANVAKTFLANWRKQIANPQLRNSTLYLVLYFHHLETGKGFGSPVVTSTSYLELFSE